MAEEGAEGAYHVMDDLPEPNMEPSPQLKPYPFCGGKAYSTGSTTYYKEHDAWFADGTRILKSYHCGCMYCGASSKGLLGQQTVELAIAAWNRRTP